MKASDKHDDNSDSDSPTDRYSDSSDSPTSCAGVESNASCPCEPAEGYHGHESLKAPVLELEEAAFGNEQTTWPIVSSPTVGLSGIRPERVDGGVDGIAVSNSCTSNNTIDANNVVHELDADNDDDDDSDVTLTPTSPVELEGTAWAWAKPVGDRIDGDTAQYMAQLAKTFMRGKLPDVPTGASSVVAVPHPRDVADKCYPHHS